MNIKPITKIEIYTAGLGFDFKHDQGLTISTDYERQQIKGHGYFDKFTFSVSYLYRNEAELAFNYKPLQNNQMELSYVKDVNGFDITFGSNYRLMSQIPDYGAMIEVSSTF